MVQLLFFLKAFFKILSASVVTSIFVGHVALAGTQSVKLDRQIETKRAQMKAVDKEISDKKKEIRNLEIEEASVMEELEALNLQLDKSRRQLREIRTENERLEARIQDLDGKRQRLVKEIKTLESYAMQRLVARYKLAELGTAQILFSSGSFFELSQKKKALERILATDAETLDRLQSQKRHLESICQKLTTSRLEHEQLQERFRQQETVIAQKRAKRAKLLEKIRARKNLTMASVASLKKAAKELDKAIRSLECRLKAVPAGARPELYSFRALKGSLPMPVSGALMGLFGNYGSKKDYNIKNFRKGVIISTKLGTPVRAVSDGRVIYASWFKGYGNIVIIDHGEHYYTVSAQLEEVLKKPGAIVVKGEAIGTVGDVGSFSGPGLYFEIRHHGKPLNPIPWFKR